ncbi:MAG: hypothetical protein GY847_22980 [Proteobacteria bacterium]|nr:hypothetical protein [Pseudomonadota bacterium]
MMTINPQMESMIKWMMLVVLFLCILGCEEKDYHDNFDGGGDTETDTGNSTDIDSDSESESDPDLDAGTDGGIDIDEYYLHRAIEFHETENTLDWHIDIPEGDQLSKWDALTHEGQFNLEKAINELKAAFLIAFVAQGERNERGYAWARDVVERKIAAIKAQAEKYNDRMRFVTTHEEAEEAIANGLFAVFIGIENGYAIGKDLGLIKVFHDMGVRYMTLVHILHNDLADSSTIPIPEHNGLSQFGREVVKKMNELGIMLTDVSHTSPKTVSDILKISNAPVIASHSCSNKVLPHSRNLSDKLIKEIAENGGVICVTAYTDYVDSSAPTVKDLVKHINHIKETLDEAGLIGIDHICIGSDFDGGSNGLEGLRDVGDMHNITAELLKEGYSEEDVKKIWWNNSLRLLGNVQGIGNTIKSLKALGYNDAQIDYIWKAYDGIYNYKYIDELILYGEPLLEAEDIEEITVSYALGPKQN